jgi:F0F1-type ATP synthase assembly protein I
MRKEFSIVVLILRILAAGIISAISYLIVCSALRPLGWALRSPLSEYENCLAIVVAALVFVLVLWRPSRGTWGKEQVDSFLNMDDAGY